MKWVTLENIGIDRMASIWLIRRWIDPKAEFIFIPPGTKSPPEAEPFDIPGARYSHYGGHCTFYSLLKENGVKDTILDHIATIVDEADVIQEINLEPAAPGLDLICRGVRRISADDNEALERGCLIYDALYAELSSGTV
ncbi:MAG TPA: chromate resistance protein ChrB domain-containing protein [Anaerolineales bacterium]|nr:chromate resistance protein ChrB domain-containing protein [Anaerolineales bacterium]